MNISFERIRIWVCIIAKVKFTFLNSRILVLRRINFGIGVLCYFRGKIVSIQEVFFILKMVKSST